MTQTIKSELPITVRTPENLLAAIDRYRASFPDKPTRPEAIRRALEESLPRLLPAAE